MLSVLTALGPDVADHFAETVESVVAQRLPAGVELEWIVCVDGPPGVIDLELPDDPRITVVHSGRPGGPGLCRNVAATRSTGSVLRNLDADDVLLPGALAADVRTLSDPRYGWCTSEALDLLPDGTTRAFATGGRDRDIARGEIVEQWRRSETLDVHVCTLAVRRRLFWAAGGYTALPRSEDVALLARLSAQCVGRHRSEPGLLYRKWPGQITAVDRDESNRAVRESITAALSS
ncbi:Glycosyl transferase family 2 [Williamsia serinedens]|uniref:4,4'-diaponeurosporenoate glycosyltransferase n=1 Tax=Williamsia serinedens TaxID=391736 RepID=A0ABT1H8M3_9NOCA|nr:Glycosyl transferase family 2 [Williamsia serinedens]